MTTVALCDAMKEFSAKRPQVDDNSVIVCIVEKEVSFLKLHHVSLWRCYTEIR